MSVRVHATTPPHLWSVVRKMHLKTGKAATRQRPDTATLEKPLILDPGLLRKVDMTRLTRDQLMTIENLIATPKKTKKNMKEQQQRITSKGSSHENKMDGWEDEESSVVENLNENHKFRKNSRVINTTFRVRSHVRKGLKEVFESPSQGTSPTRKDIAKTKSPKENTQTNREKSSVEDVFGALIASNHVVPSPCSTCGRPEKPERLHAHPSVPRNKRSRLKDDQENTTVGVQQKNSVTKPVAMKFRSGKSRAEKHPLVEKHVTEQIKSQVQKEAKDQRKAIPLIRRETFRIERSPKPILSVEKNSTPSPSPTRKTYLPVNSSPRRQALLRTPEKQISKPVSPMPPPFLVPTNPPVVHSASPRRPRTITCHLCQKQFGTASYPLHEPQCLQKWQREYQALPPNELHPQPRRPSASEPWGQAWEAAQAAMVSCDRCSKTFLPHRLDAHLRVCPQNSPVKKPSPPKQLQECESAWEDRSERSERSSVLLLDGPTSIHCHICGRVFNRTAVDHHEQQCLKRWQLEHSSRESGSSAVASPASSPPSSAQSTPRRRLIICYLCGRQFGTTSIAIHEPQCLRKWQQENEKLPHNQRRPEPQRPEAVYDPVTGQVDYQATEEAQWQCHLVQLVPCAKCGRTFNPDRIAVHEKCCKGPIKH